MLTRFARIVLVVAAVVAVVVGAGALRSSAAVPGIPSIYVNYNADCTFSMSVDGGITVNSSTAPGPTLPPGVYQLLVWMPNPNQGYTCGKPTFTFTGPGVSTSTVFQGQELHDERVIPALQPSSTYVAQDASSPATQRVFTTAASGSNSVLLPASTDNGTGTSTQPALVGSEAAASMVKLVAIVSAAGKATLKLDGRNVGALKAGRYDIKVDDAARKAGFFVGRSSRKSVTVSSVAFVGKRTEAVTLTAGKWMFFSKIGKPTAFTVIT